jgi:Ca-activated chloride channel family protein
MNRLLLTVLIAAFGLCSCGDDRRSASPKESSAAPAPAVPAKPAWPPIGEGQRLSANPLARNYYIVFDASGSMSETRCADGHTKIDAAKMAIAAFADSLPADANLGLLAFDGAGIRERLPLEHAGRAEIRSVVDNIYPGGVTPLRSAIAKAYEAITEQGKRQLGYGEYHLVVVTDGEFNPNSENPADVVEQILGRSPVVIHTIGFCIGVQHSLNQEGRTFYKAANNPDELKRGLDDVLAESPSFDVKTFR